MELGSASVINVGQYAMLRDPFDKKEPSVRPAISAACNLGHWECR